MRLDLSACPPKLYIYEDVIRKIRTSRSERRGRDIKFEGPKFVLNADHEAYLQQTLQDVLRVGPDYVLTLKQGTIDKLMFNDYKRPQEQSFGANIFLVM